MSAVLSVCCFVRVDDLTLGRRALEALQDEHPDVIDDVAAVEWPAGCVRPRTWQVRGLAGPGVLSGAYWGLVLGSLFLLPLTTAGQRVPAPASATFGALGLDDAVVDRLRTSVRPGTAALFVLSRDGAASRVQDVLGRAGSIVVSTRIDAELERGLRAAFSDGDVADS